MGHTVKIKCGLLLHIIVDKRAPPQIMDTYRYLMTLKIRRTRLDGISGPPRSRALRAVRG